MNDNVTVLRLFDPPASQPVNRLAGLLAARAIRRALQGVDEVAITAELLDLAGGDEHAVAATLERTGLAA